MGKNTIHTKVIRIEDLSTNKCNFIDANSNNACHTFEKI